MFRFIRRLLGIDATTVDDQRTDETAPVTDRSDDHRVSDAYFDSMSRMRAALSNRDYPRAAQFVRENLEHIPAWVKDTRREFGSFDIRSIPALQQGGTILGLVGDDEGLARMQETVASLPELQPWTQEVDRHLHDRNLFESIMELVAVQPNCLQTQVKELIGESDGRRVANLLAYLDKAGKIRRVKAGRTYRLLPPDSPDVPAQPPKRVVRSHRTDRRPPRLREIDLESLTYVPLPRSPLRWEEAQVSSKQAAPQSEDHFEIRDADWRIVAVERIPPAQRPDTAFRQLYPTDSGLLMIDDLGKADGLGQIEAAAMRYDRLGEVTAKRALLHGIYRTGVHPLGRGLIAMSRDCVVHAYDDHLQPILETRVTEAPEIPHMRKRFEIPDEQLKNHIRCVALSANANRYLFTAVDEAWCVALSGQGLWGVKLPVKDGWTRVTNTTSEFGTSVDVDRALALMDLPLPFTPEDLKRRYRELAKRWHPDLNPSDPQAGDQMKALTAAAEVLTGVEASALPRYTGATFVHEMELTEFHTSGTSFTVSIGMEAGELHASDWIYAAGFAARSDAVYLAGYSGRVVLVDENGRGKRIYDIGNAPRRIVDTGDYLYLLTDTRLYVLHDDALHALVDTFDGGDVIVAQTAFGLLEKKRLRWFREDGRYLGSVLSKDPIRRVYATEEGMAVESRQRRALIEGVPTWWE